MVLKKIIELIKNDISLYSSHTNLDVVTGGINDEIVKLLGFNNSEIIEKIDCKAYLSAGIGRMVRLNKKMTTEQIVSLVKEKLDIDNVRVVVGTNEIDKIASAGGSSKGPDVSREGVQRDILPIVEGSPAYPTMAATTTSIAGMVTISSRAFSPAITLIGKSLRASRRG